MTQRIAATALFTQAARHDLHELGWAGPLKLDLARKIQTTLRDEGIECVVERSDTTIPGEWYKLVLAKEAI